MCQVVTYKRFDNCKTFRQGVVIDTYQRFYLLGFDWKNFGLLEVVLMVGGCT